jgi:hypothetical protein
MDAGIAQEFQLSVHLHSGSEPTVKQKQVSRPDALIAQVSGSGTNLPQ